MPRLFGYGTLRHPAWRAAILGATYAAENATLAGWRRSVTSSGYFSIVGDANSSIDGVAIALDAIGWTIADAWEEVPRYERVAVDIRTASGLDAAYVYVSRELSSHGAHAQDTHPRIDPERFALLDEAAVEDAIARFVPQMRALRAGAAASAEAREP